MAKRPAPPILSQRRPSAFFQKSYSHQPLPPQPDHSDHRPNGKGSKKVELELTRVTSRGASNDQISSSSFTKLKVTRYILLEPLGISYSNVEVQPWVIGE
ncbi:hypothetical protein BDV38DRAFT_276123 [Aspergillus pseudotamarii]|uniref:Uncharacterized protein n=1 Tax=Aspergillus pseudotamarii TaxID=132259 RepID=A0A5N6SBD5_ASPPS|nr:uncharacterized protein BDV38DRAFT_276123 [Aspergillus pseudotamarii]KAE8131257.1 hypothetical protein BDV38DRAFT_276123 [Aspergillus pseudotamarii]